MTEDADFKRLVRERMEQTGESYATARRHLRPDEPHESSSERTTFSLSTDPVDQQVLTDLVTRTIDGGVTVVDGRLHVWMGDPPSWESWIPLRSILSAERLADGAPLYEPSRWRSLRVTSSASTGSTTVMSRGAHGWRGRWLVNASDRNLVRLVLAVGVRANLAIGHVLPDDVVARGGRVIRFFAKDRSVKLKELIVSVDDPDRLVAKLRDGE